MTLITMDEVAVMLNVTKSYVHQLTERGVLSCFRFGKKAVRYDRDEVVRYIENSRELRGKKKEEEKPDEEN